MNPIPCSYDGAAGYYVGFNKDTRKYKIELLSGKKVETDFLHEFEPLEESEFKDLLQRSCVVSDPGDEQSSIINILNHF